MRRPGDRVTFEEAVELGLVEAPPHIPRTTKPSLWFVTPAFERADLSAVCFAHRAWAIRELRAAGIDAHCVVITGRRDPNHELALAHGFQVELRDNEFLGRKWNDGYQAAAEAGAEWVVPMGSDSWIHPSFFANLPDRPGRRDAVTGRRYAVVHEDGGRLAHLEITACGGVGPNVLPTPLLEPVGYRPVREQIQRGCDGSLIAAVERRGRLRWQWVDVAPLQYVGFRTHGAQLNPYETLASKYATGESDSPWEDLAEEHPADLVEQAQRVYVRRRRLVAA